MKEVDGDLVALAKEGKFDVIAHGCNCFCAMGSGIAPQIAQAFPWAEEADNRTIRGDYNKLGNYTLGLPHSRFVRKKVHVFNLYSQYKPGEATFPYDIPLDYDALALSLRKMRHLILSWESDVKIGLPKIGAGLAGGDWTIIKEIMDLETEDLDVTIVNYVK